MNLQRLTSEPLLTVDDITWDFKLKRSIMFPSVIDMEGRLETPIDRYYMYLASHGGREIGLATAPELEGPWTVQETPILHLDACPAATGHLSSPDIVYDSDTHRFILYYHGNCPDDVLAEQNRRMPTHDYHRIQNSGAATSIDGVHFDVHPNPLLLPITTPDHWRVATNMYLRVVKTRSGFHGFFMTMSRDEADYNGVTRSLPKRERSSRPHPTSIAHAWSADGLDWVVDEDRAVLTAEASFGEFHRIRHIGVTQIGDSHVLATYSCFANPEETQENIFSATLLLDGKAAHLVEKHGAVLTPELAWEAGNLRDPYPLVKRGRLYVFYAGGGEKGIGLAATEDGGWGVNG
jgi:hypothetical protein